MENLVQFFNNEANLLLVYLLLFTIILGFEVISKVPTVLHTPLMSGANAISGVVIIGAILLIRQSAPDDYLLLSLGFLGVVLGMVNVVGGFAVTDRMLEMFKKKKTNTK
jgi:NAD(P) transhydrogenase subunit alpha